MCARLDRNLPKKSKLEILKGNVDAQELRLQEALNSLEAAKTHPQDNNKLPFLPHLKYWESRVGQQMSSSWDMLERVIGLEGDLLTSYREYTREYSLKVVPEVPRSFP